MTEEKQALLGLREKYPSLGYSDSYNSVRKQLNEWRKFDLVIGAEDTKTQEDFSKTISDLKKEGLDYKGILPKGYVVEVKGTAKGDSSTFYRATADEKALTELETQLTEQVQSLDANERQSLLTHYSERERDLITEKDMLEHIADEERTALQKERLVKIDKELTDIAEQRKQTTEKKSAVDRIKDSAKNKGQLLSWLKRAQETLQLKHNIREVIPSVSFKKIFEAVDKDNTDKTTKYDARLLKLREVHKLVSDIKAESFEDFQKRIKRDGLESLTTWLPKGAFLKIQDKEESKDALYYRTFISEEIQQLDKELSANLQTIEEKDKEIYEIFKRQAEAKLKFLQEAEEKWPTAEGSARKIAIEKTQNRLANFSKHVNAADWIKKIEGYNARYQVAKRNAKELTDKLAILEEDPNVYLGKEFSYDDTAETLRKIKDDAAIVADIKSRYDAKSYDNEYLSKFGTKAEQAEWWQAFDQEYQWLTTATQKQVSDKLNSLDSEEFRNYRRLFPDNFFDTFFVKQDKLWYRIGTDVNEQEADDIRERQKERDELKRKREKAILATGQKSAPSVTASNVFGIANSNRMADSSVIDKVTEMSKLTGQAFSDSYDQLLVTEREVYDRNFGKPIESNGTWYQNIFVMPNDAWKDFEEQNGRAIPRVRPGVDKQESYDVVAEQELQQKITADIRERSWNFVPKTGTALPAQQTPSSPSVTPETKETAAKTVRPKPVAVIKEQKSAIEKVLQELRSPTTMKSMGMMGLAGAFALWNMAMTGPSREAQEHRRRVEEERRMRQYGY